MSPMDQTPDEVLQAASALLGAPVRVDWRRGWATFWCPFHPDSAQRGRRRQPNFGVNLEAGFWKCLRCGASGGSLRALAEKLGQDWRPPAPAPPPRARAARPGAVGALDEAVAAARRALLRSPACGYLKQRGVTLWAAAVYGLGYGVATPHVSARTWGVARRAGLVCRDGTWLWGGGVVYADPPFTPTAIHVRYLPLDLVPPAVRPFAAEARHRSWGERRAPLGAWRVQPQTKVILVVEGLFDLLVGAQVIWARGLHPEVVPVYTAGASPARAMLDWFSAHDYAYVLIPDPDPMGGAWAARVGEAAARGGGAWVVATPPAGLDPDEAFLSGWWPQAL